MDAKAEYTTTTVITRGGQAGEAARLLVDPHGSGWQLPVFTLSADDSRALAPALRAAVAERFGLAVAVLSVLHAERDEAAGARHALVALDAYSVPKDGTEPAGAAWLSLDELGSVAFPTADQAARVRLWLSELAPGAGHPQRLPWTRPGWLAAATAWIETQIAGRGLRLAGPIEQHRTWSLSVLLRVPLAEGSAYFKALPSIFAAEPRLTRALAQRFPGRLPQVIALDAARHWLLMPAFTGQLLQTCTELPVWIDALQDYARLQIESAADPQALLALGCPDRRLGVLPGQFAALLAEADGLSTGADNALNAAELQDVEALLPVLPAACTALEACGLPYTLEHGDLHGNNIAVTPAGGFIFFDWSDGCLAHPFTCLTTFLETVPAEWQPPLAKAYAEAWRAYASTDELDRALRLARPLGAAHLAVSYANILRATEPGQRWQLAGALPFFLREFLKYKDALLNG